MALMTWSAWATPYTAETETTGVLLQYPETAGEVVIDQSAHLKPQLGYFYRNKADFITMITISMSF